MDRFYRRKRHRAVTLLELALAASFFAILGLIMFLSTQQGLSSQRKAWVTQDAQQAVRLAQQRLRAELRVSRITTPTIGESGPVLTYEKVEMVDHQVVFTEEGAPNWEGAYTLGVTTDGTLLSTRLDEDGEIVNTDNLSSLGPDAEIEFERLSQRRLVVNLRASRGEEGTNLQHSTAEARVEFFLKN